MFSTRSQVRIGEVGGHEIRLDVVAFGILALYVLMSRGSPTDWNVAFLVAVFLSVLVHELGHAFAVSRLTGRGAVVVIGFGGFTAWPGTTSPGRKLGISLAGPGLGLVLGLAAWGVAAATSTYYGPLPWQFGTEGSIWRMFLLHTVWASLLWSLANLAPVLPLDGGQALRALLGVLGMREEGARRWTRRVSIAAALPLGIWALSLKAVLAVLVIAWCLLHVAGEAQREGW